MYNDQIAVVSFYGFTNIESPEILLQKALLIGKRKYVRGTILIANEGFNGSISGKKENLRAVVDEFIKITGAQNVNIKTNFCAEHPFQKYKVKLKKEIVAFGIEDLDVENLKGDYVEPKDWDEFISKPDVITIDTRNSYEIKAGTFRCSVDPKTDTFKQFPAWVESNKELLKNKKIAMCCTGGIRCEKSTAYLKKIGYDKVYHLKGGILQYLEDTNNKNQLWEGECFVFDDRGRVNSDLNPAEGSWLKRDAQ